MPCRQKMWWMSVSEIAIPGAVKKKAEAGRKTFGKLLQSQYYNRYGKPVLLS